MQVNSAMQVCYQRRNVKKVISFLSTNVAVVQGRSRCRPMGGSGAIA